MEIQKNKLFEILKKIQLYQNEFIKLKRTKNSLEMVKIMWDIGDLMFTHNIKNPHSLGWEAERQKAFIKRPLVFRSFVIRRIWDSKDQLQKDLYGVKSVNSLIEFFPLLDQNKKWKVPEAEIKRLFGILNTKPAAIFNRELKKLKQKYIGIRNDRRIHLGDLATLKQNFYIFFNNFENLITKSQMQESLDFANEIGFENLKIFGKLCLYIATKKDIDIKSFEHIHSKNEEFNQLYRQLLESTKTKDRTNRVRRVIDPLDLIKTTDFCNSSQNEEGIKAFRLREGFQVSVK